MAKSFFDTKIDYLKGVGPEISKLLNTELKIFTYGDLLQHYPTKHEDRRAFHDISELSMEHTGAIQLKGRITYLETIGEGRKERLVAKFRDETGSIDLVWFRGLKWVKKKMADNLNKESIVYGKLNHYNGSFNIMHPEYELLNTKNEDQTGFLLPIYKTTEKLKKKYLDSKKLRKLIQRLLDIALPNVRETLPPTLIKKYELSSKQEALAKIHFPDSDDELYKARYRLKFEELFYTQIRLLKKNLARKNEYRGQVFKKTDILTEFYKEHLPFDFTGAQKRVVREIFKDMASGKQMNRLLQGDVGSGKTIVAFVSMLLAINGGTQACIMAPTEILAEQHYEGLSGYAEKLGITIDILTGSSKTSERKLIHEYLESGDLQILIGTHALLEDKVQFSNLGLVVIDEQHRFGVEQRSKLWKKNDKVFPHILVMTATPIPRTLAMTLYGDLDVSVIDELPPGRKPVKTVQRQDAHRISVFGFIRDELAKGRQVYMVYPLIEQSEKLDQLKDLEDGYESITRAFPKTPIGILHGRMKPKDKDYEMQRFVKNETKIMVATTVIEVGVNVPNASIMIIENAERFGLSQLHQLRGRVGRGAEQSFCILMTNYKMSKEAKERIRVMCETNDGFEIANMDLKIRGPGDLMGTQQSGVLDLIISDLGKDGNILKLAREEAYKILENDLELSLKENISIKIQLNAVKKNTTNWARIS